MRNPSVFVVICLLALPAASGISSPLTAPIEAGLAPVLNHLPHGPLRIDGDAEFCMNPVKSGVVNCESATGTPENPYVIEGWSIQADTDSSVPALSISNTTSFAVVRGNFFVTPTNGSVPTVVARNVQNLLIEDNMFRPAHGPALVATDVAGATDPASPWGRDFLRGNSFIGGASRDGSSGLVALARVSGANVSGNGFHGTGNTSRHVPGGVSITDGNDVTFSGNIYSRINGTGLSAQNVSGLVLASEDFHELRTGISIVNATRPILVGVTMMGVQSGIRAAEVETLSIATSSLSDSYPCDPACLPGVGIGVTNSNLVVSQTNVTDFATGISFQGLSPHVFTGYCLSVTNSSGHGILVTNLGSGLLRQSTIVGNGIGIENRDANPSGGATFNASENWWGHESGPFHATKNPLGQGDSAVGKIQVENWLTEAPTC